MKAVALHQIGLLYQEKEEWNEAEKYYRLSAQLKESQNMICGRNSVVMTWANLGIVYHRSGRYLEAEAWYKKAINGFRDNGDLQSLFDSLHNLADLLKGNDERLHEIEQIEKEMQEIQRKS